MVTFFSYEEVIGNARSKVQKAIDDVMSVVGFGFYLALYRGSYLVGVLICSASDGDEELGIWIWWG